ncbi:MAG: flavodoxin domain-containing protein, partial [Pseudomonadota bacterium]
MNILIAFGSTEGHTRKIAHHVSNTLKNAGHGVDLFDCSSTETVENIAEFDAIVVAGSVHQEAHQTSVVNFVKEHLKILGDTPSSLISVSLSASLPEAKN